MNKKGLYIINFILMGSYALFLAIEAFRMDFDLIAKTSPIGAFIAMGVGLVNSRIGKLDQNKIIKDTVERESLRRSNDLKISIYQAEIKQLHTILKLVDEMVDNNYKFHLSLLNNIDSKKILELASNTMNSFESLMIESISLLNSPEKNSDVIDAYLEIFDKIKPQSLNNDRKYIQKWFIDFVNTNPDLYSDKMKSYNNEERLIQILIRIVGEPLKEVEHEMSELSHFGSSNLTDNSRQNLIRFSELKTKTSMAITYVLQSVIEVRMSKLKNYVTTNLKL